MIKSISEDELSSYGYFLKDDFSKPLEYLKDRTPLGKEDGSNIYVADDHNLHAYEVFSKVKKDIYEGEEIEIGYCNGYNQKLNCLENHACSEVDVALNDLVLLLALPSDIKNGKINTKDVKALKIKAGQAFVLHPYVLHFSPCEVNEKGFKSLVILTKGTNEPLDSETMDKRLWRKNKWLYAHKESKQAKQGAYIGLVGENLTYPLA